MYPGGHCALFTAGMGAAAAGVSTISVARVATGFMSLHSARVINLGHYAHSVSRVLHLNRPEAAFGLGGARRTSKELFRVCTNKCPRPSRCFWTGGAPHFYFQLARGALSGAKSWAYPSRWSTHCSVRSFLRSSHRTRHLVSMEQKSCWNVFYRTNFMGSGPMPEDAQIVQPELGLLARMVAEVERWLRPVDDFDYLIRRWLTPVHFEEPTQSTPPKKVFVQRTAPLSSYVQHAIGQHLRLQYALESSLPLRLAKLATEVEQRNSMAEGSYAST